MHLHTKTPTHAPKTNNSTQPYSDGLLLASPSWDYIDIDKCAHFDMNILLLLFYFLLPLLPLLSTVVSQCHPQVSQLPQIIVDTTRNCGGGPPTRYVISEPCRVSDY